MAISVDWVRIPINVRSEKLEELKKLLEYLNKKGLKKHSIIMPDREEGGFIFFIYEKIEKDVLEKWVSEGV